MSFTQQKQFCPRDRCHVHLPQSSSVRLLDYTPVPLPFLEPLVPSAAGPAQWASFFRRSLFLSRFPLEPPSFYHWQVMTLYPGRHPKSSSVDNCLFAPPFNYHLYCSDTSLLLGTSLLDPVFLTSNWMSFGCLLHSWNSVHQETKEAFSSQTCFSSQRFCLRICAWESENPSLESQLTIFSCLIPLTSTSKTMLACSWS